jgi:PAS domain S-box-containing protein
MILRGIKLARSVHVLYRVGIATVAVAAATAVQLPADVDLPGEPFLLYFVIVLLAGVFGRTPGFVAVAETTIASVLYFDPIYSLRLTHATDLLAIEIYAVAAALSVETLCRLVDSALAERSEANVARSQQQEAQARLASIVTSSADAIIGKTLDGIVTSWNEAAERMFGYSAGEMIGHSIRRLIPTDRQAEEDSILSRMARSESIERHETSLLARDGRIFEASVTVSPMQDAEGRVIGCSKIIRDITQRKRTEARLAEREAQLALFAEHAPAAIAMFDAKMYYLAVSRRFVSDFRLPGPAELIGRSHYDVFPDIPPRWRELHARVLSGEELAHEEDEFARQGGPTYWLRWSMKPWRTADGRIGGALLFSEVITEQVTARRALADSEARFRATFENAAVGIAHLAPDLRWLRAN